MASPGMSTVEYERGVTSELESRVVEINKAFAGWIMASWEMCPTHVWTGAAQEYCNKIDKLMKEFSIDRGGSDMHLSSNSTAAAGDSRGAISNHPKSPPPPFATAPIAATAAKASNNSSPNTNGATTAPSPSFAFAPCTMQPLTTPITADYYSSKPSNGMGSPTVPSPIPCNSPNKGNSTFQTQQHAPISTPSVVTATATASKSASRKRRATEDPEGAPNAHNPPKPPLFSSILTSQQPTQPAALASVPSISFGTSKSAQLATGASEKTSSQSNGSVICGSFAAPKPALFSFNKSSGGASDKSGAGSGAAASSAVAPGADSLKPFAALFSTSSAGGTAASQPLFGSTIKPADSSSAATGTGSAGFGGLFGSTTAKTDTNVAASFSFGQGAGTPLFGAGSGFGGAGGVMASVSTPTFGTLGLATTGVSNTAAAAAPAAAATTDDDDGAEKEPTQKVELKGDDKTDIQFSGKTTFRFMVDGKWTDGTLGALTVRKDKASGTSWIQVNNESKGNIILYAAFIKSAAATVGEAKSTLLVPLNVFKYPPGNEPKKTVDDGAGGRKTLPEKEENPPSVKNVMFKVRADNLKPLSDTLTAVGIKCNKK